MKTSKTKEQERMERQPEDRDETSPIDTEEMTQQTAEEAADMPAETGSEEPGDAQWQRQAEESQNRFLRVQADFDNFRRRTQKEKEELAQYASLKLVGQLLPVLDNFGRALESAPDADEGNSFSKGIDMIYRQLSQVLENEGLRKMEAVGQPFDPELHQAIMQVESEEHEDGTVVEVVQHGYWLRDKLLRPAMVKVSG